MFTFKFSSMEWRLFAILLVSILAPALTVGGFGYFAVSETIKTEKTNWVGREAEGKWLGITAQLKGTNARASAFLTDLQTRCFSHSQSTMALCAESALTSFAQSEQALGATLHLPPLKHDLSVGMSPPANADIKPFKPGQIARFTPPTKTGDRMYYVIADNPQDGAQLVVTFAIDRIQNIFSDSSHLGISGESFLTDENGYFITRPKYASTMGHSHPIATHPMEMCLSGENDKTLDLDYRNIPIIHGFHYVPEIGGGCIMAHIDQDEAFAPLRALISLASLFTLLFIVLAIAISRRLGHTMVQPIIELKTAALKIRNGNYDARVNIDGGDEISELARCFNLMTEQLAMTIGELREQKSMLEHRVKERTSQLADSINDLRKTHLTLQISETTYRSLFENMLNGFAYCKMVYEDGIPSDFLYISTNQAFETLTGLTNVVGRKISEILPGFRETDSSLLNIDGQVASTGQPTRFEIYVEALHMWFWVSVYSPKPEYFVAIFDVITERKLAEKALHESRELLRLFVEHAPASLAMFDRDMRYIAVSRRWCQDYRIGDRNIIGCSHFDVFPNIPQRWKDVLNQGLKGNVITADEDRLDKADGTVQWLQWEVRPWLTDDNAIGGIVVFTEDITRKKQSESEQRLIERLEHQRQIAVESTLAEERQRKAIAEDLHDYLGQTLHVLQLKLGSLAKDLPDDPNIEVQIHDLTDLIIIASGMVRTLTTRLSPPSLKELGLIAAFSWLAEDMERIYGLTVTINDDTQPKPLSFDKSAVLFRVVRELVINVAKHSGVDHAHIEAAVQDLELRIFVIDKGIGLNGWQDVIAAQKSFGLVSVNERIFTLGGNMDIQTPPEGGTVVTLRIPLDPAPS